MVGKRKSEGVKSVVKSKKAAPPKKAQKKVAPPKKEKVPPKNPVVDEALLEKIKRRAKRAWEAPNEVHHRITEVKENSLLYRLPHEEGQPEYSGRKLVVKKDSRGRIRVS